MSSVDIHSSLHTQQPPHLTYTGGREVPVLGGRKVTGIVDKANQKSSVSQEVCIKRGMFPNQRGPVL